jgi:hypothetical protein
MPEGEADPTLMHKDRSVGLVIFGVLQILVGVCCAALVPLSLMAQQLGTIAGASSADPRSAFPGMVVYAALATAFVWLGIGSVRARRWAREVSLSLSWVWLLTGICSLILAWLLLPSVLGALAGEGGFPVEVTLLVTVVTTAVLGIVYVLLPGAFVLFFRSPDVAATCHARDPGRQWTDDLPQRLITLILVWALAAVSVLVMPAYRFVVPFFGVVLVGSAGAIVWLVILIGCVALVWGSARREPWAWWGAMIGVFLAGVSTVLTSLKVETSEFLRAMDLPGDQADLLSAAMTPDRWLVVLFWLAAWGSFLAYLANLRRFFVAGSADADD